MSSNNDSQVVSGGLMRLFADTLVLSYKAGYLSWFSNEESWLFVILGDQRILQRLARKIACRMLVLGREISPSYEEIIQCSTIKHEIHSLSLLELAIQLLDDHTKTVCDIDTLLVTLPLSEDKDSLTLLEDARETYSKYQQKLCQITKSHDREMH